jgi:hypothetical protein
MTDFAAVQPVSTGAVITEQSGTTPGTDTVPAGCCVVVRNTGAGVHNLVIGVAATLDGMQVMTTAGTLGTRRIPVTNGTQQVVRVPSAYGDANGRVPFGVLEGTFSEIKYYVVGA